MRVVGLGAISGMRTFSGLAFLSRHLEAHPSPSDRFLLSALSHPAAARGLTGMAAAELVGDKLPNTPARIEAPGLLGRGVAGALVGAAAAYERERSGLLGLILGLSAALVSAFAFYHARRAASEQLGLPDVLVALVEDSLVWLGGKWSVR